MKRLLRLLMWVVFLSAVAGAVAVAFIDLPKPTRQIERPASLDGLGAE